MPREPLAHEQPPQVQNPTEPAGDMVQISKAELDALMAKLATTPPAPARAANRPRNKGRFQKKGAAPAVHSHSSRQEHHSADTRIEQRPVVTGDHDRAHVVEADPAILAKKDYLDRIAMGEEPVTIRISPSTEKNAPQSYYCAVNGKGAEVLLNNGEWVSLLYLPVGVNMIVKRKYVEILARAKVDSIETDHGDATVAQPHNRTKSTTSSLASFSIIRDDNPRSKAWLEDIMRRNY